MSTDPIELRRVTVLGDDIVPLVEEAEREGHRFMRRLRDEWRSGANRFQCEGEFLLSAHAGERLVAIGGLNRDPYSAAGDVGRLRHVYVSSAARRLGVGTALVKSITEGAGQTFAVIRLRTATAEAVAFYQRLGFQRIDDDTATHVIGLQT